MNKVKLQPTWRTSPGPYLVIIALWLAYAGLSIWAPAPAANPNPYHLSGLTKDLLILTIILPVLVIWLVALRGVLALRRYTRLIDGSPEAPAMRLVASGLGWMAAFIIVMTLAGVIMPFLVQSPWQQAAVIVRNHLPAYVALVGSILLYLGSHRLQVVTSTSTWTRGTLGVYLGFAVFAAAFTAAFTLNDLNANSSGVLLQALPKTALVFSLIIPYLAGWLLGILACVNILKYAHTVNGIIYRSALRWLVLGVLNIIFFGIITQVLAIVSRFFTGLSLMPILAILYVILVFYGAGFWFIQAGTRRLARLEAVQ